MKNHACSKCGNTVYFENVHCVKCGADLGFDPERLAMITIEPLADPSGAYRPVGLEGAPMRYCANAAHAACNWLTPVDGSDGFCLACDLNRTIPDLSVQGNLDAWQELERAKKRLVYDLLRFGLPLDTRATGGERLTFDFLLNATTGHLDGVITIDVTEANAVERERQRLQFGEPYRSLLGHLRHESGHFYWNVLVAEAGKHEAFRALFGDERMDYGAALARHHTEGPPPDWSANHVSAYASAHPWEDWAETWAHYLQISDTLSTAVGFGFGASDVDFEAAPFTREALHAPDHPDGDGFLAIMNAWVELTAVLNELARSLGLRDVCPSVLSGTAVGKLHFVHLVITGAGR